MGLRLLNPYLTSRAMNSSSVALRRQDQDPILSSSPQISGFPSSAARLTLLARYESYGTQRSAIRGIVFGTLNLRHSSHTSTDNSRFTKPKLNGYGILRPNSADALLCVLCTAPPPLLSNFHYTDFHYDLLLQCHHIASGNYHLSVLTDHPSILRCRA